MLHYVVCSSTICQSCTHEYRSKSRIKIKCLFSPFSPLLKLIAELQTSVCDAKEEAVRLQQAMERQLEEANTRWDQERRTIIQHADQANKVSVGHLGDHSLNHTLLMASSKIDGIRNKINILHFLHFI